MLEKCFVFAGLLSFLSLFTSFNPGFLSRCLVVVVFLWLPVLLLEQTSLSLQFCDPSWDLAHGIKNLDRYHPFIFVLPPVATHIPFVITDDDQRRERER